MYRQSARLSIVLFVSDRFVLRQASMNATCGKAGSRALGVNPHILNHPANGAIGTGPVRRQVPVQGEE
jgi:hypothetical protein